MTTQTMTARPDTLAAANPNQKGGDLALSLTPEILASSKSVLAQTRSGGVKGMQQFFTPPQVAGLIRSVLDPTGDGWHVLDLTAGDGSLLAPYASAHRIGIEIDAVQVKAAKTSGTGYRALIGDVQKIAPLLALTGQQFGRIVLNPPFGLTWQVKGKPMSSTKAALTLALSLLAPGGQGAIVGGTDRMHRELLADPALAHAVYAEVTLPAGTFPGVELATSVLFFASPSHRNSAKSHRPLVSLPFGEGAAGAVQAARNDLFQWLSRYDSLDPHGLASDARQVQAEHDRRRAQEEGTGAADVCLDYKSRISVKLTELTLKTLYAEAHGGVVSAVKALEGKRVNYFALNGREWGRVKALAADGLLTLDAHLDAQVQAVIDRAAALSCPVYPIKPQQRLGYLADTENILCIQSDPAGGFEAGKSYPVQCQSRIAKSERKEIKEVPSASGGMEVKELIWTRKAKVLDICLTPGGNKKAVTLSEEKKDIDYLLAHFDIPDPGDLATRFPAAMEKQAKTLRSVEAQYLTPRGIALKGYQREDLARLMVKQGGLLSWEQGLGKTLGAMMFAAAEEAAGHTDGTALFIAPQDLISQWQEEAEKFFGRKLVWIKTRAEARTAAAFIKSEREEAKGDPFYDQLPRWYITHYEALSLAGTTGKVEMLVGTEDGPERQKVRTRQGQAVLPKAPVRTITKQKLIRAGYRMNANGISEWHNAESKAESQVQTTAQLCPQCWQQRGVVTDTEEKDDAGRRLYDGVCCRRCGWAGKALHLKSMAHELTTAFKQGCIIVDEATKIKGDSLQSLAVRGLRARRKVVMTGTPVKNFVVDLFHLLGWGLGYNSPRFPYPYGEGAEQFKRDFCVIESLGGKGGREKVLPEVTNLSVLWKLLSGSMVRRRKEDSGEPLVPRTFIPVTVPMGTAQRTQYAHWLHSFPHFYCDKNPEADYGMVEANSALLGLNHKLEYATTLPLADPDFEYFGVPVSDMTPKSLKVCEIAGFHTARGERVLIGSVVQKTGKFLAETLNEKGIPAAHILEEDAQGKVKTKNPQSRSGVIKDFRTGNTRVLCASVQALAYGHNMDQASVVILDGLPWDYATLDQFLARVHRLSSKRPVTVYVVMTDGSLDETKWERLEKKSKAANLTLDGEMFEKTQEPESLQSVLNDLVERGLPAADTIDEANCLRLWEGQTFTLQPIGSAFVETQPEAAQPAAQPAQARQDTLFTFETVKPKKAAYIPAAHAAPTVQQGMLFAL